MAYAQLFAYSVDQGTYSVDALPLPPISILELFPRSQKQVWLQFVSGGVCGKTSSCKIYEYMVTEQGSGKKKFNSLPNDKFLDWSKLKALADDKINVAEKLKFVLGRIERKPEFSHFSTMFSKGFFFKVAISRDCMVKC